MHHYWTILVSLHLVLTKVENSSLCPQTAILIKCSLSWEEELLCDDSGCRGWRASCGSSWWTMFRKVKKRHSSSSSQSSEISTKSKVKQHTHFIHKFLLFEFSQHFVMFLTIYSLWTPVWGGSPDPALSPALTPIPTRALVSLIVLFAFPFFLFFVFCD